MMFVMIPFLVSLEGSHQSGGVFLLSGSGCISHAPHCSKEAKAQLMKVIQQTVSKPVYDTLREQAAYDDRFKLNTHQGSRLP